MLTRGAKPLNQIAMHTQPRATIELSNIASNWKSLASMPGAKEVGAVVKANAYGLHAARVCKTLKDAGCKTFFTATMTEGAEVRAIVGPEPDIIIFHGITDAEVDLAKTHKLRPVLNTLHQLRTWRMHGLRETGPAILHFDTGMNRLGLRHEDVPAVKEMLDGREVGIVMSHLSCADETDNPCNAAQRESFLELAAHWPDARKSLANSAAMALGADYMFDLTRPGIALYGGGVPINADITSVLTLEAPILSVFMAPKGASTGYGATRRFGRTRRLATVALGYADGFPRTSSNNGFGFIAGERCKIVGRVSMDLLTLDVTDLACMIAPGMMVELIGPNADLEAQADEASTLGYELLTGLGKRIEFNWND